MFKDKLMTTLGEFLGLVDVDGERLDVQMMMVEMKIILKKMMKIISMKTQFLCFVHN